MFGVISCKAIILFFKGLISGECPTKKEERKAMLDSDSEDSNSIEMNTYSIDVQPIIEADETVRTDETQGKSQDLEYVEEEILHDPPEDDEELECAVCCEEINKTNYCEYRTVPSMTWLSSNYCENDIKHFMSIQYHDYLENLRKSDCKAEIRKMLEVGPPIYVHDKHGLPIPDEDTHIDMIWLSSTNSDISAKLDGALEGEAREKQWEELRDEMKQALDVPEEETKEKEG